MENSKENTNIHIRVERGNMTLLATSFLVVQWLEYLTSAQKVTGLIPVRDFFFVPHT